MLFAGKDANLYGYVISDPVNYVDASGNFLQVVVGALAGAAFDLASV